MNELLHAVSAFMDYVQANPGNFNIQTQQEIASFLQEVWQFIEEYNTRNPTEILPPNLQQFDLDQAPYPSSNINAFKYDPSTKELLVKFMGKDTADSGPIYKYDGISKFIYDTFARGAVPPKTSGRNKYHKWIKGVMPSLGAAMYHLIRNNYNYQRVS